MKSFLKPHSRTLREFQSRVLRSRFFVVSAALHLLLIATFGTRKFFKKLAAPPDFAVSDLRVFLRASQPASAAIFPIEARTAHSPFKEAAAPTPEISVANAAAGFRNRQLEFTSFV